MEKIWQCAFINFLGDLSSTNNEVINFQPVAAIQFKQLSNKIRYVKKSVLQETRTKFMDVSVLVQKNHQTADMEVYDIRELICLICHQIFRETSSIINDQQFLSIKKSSSSKHLDFDISLNPVIHIWLIGENTSMYSSHFCYSKSFLGISMELICQSIRSCLYHLVCALWAQNKDAFEQLQNGERQWFFCLCSKKQRHDERSSIFDFREVWVHSCNRFKLNCPKWYCFG